MTRIGRFALLAAIVLNPIGAASEDVSLERGLEFGSRGLFRNALSAFEHSIELGEMPDDEVWVNVCIEVATAAQGDLITRGTAKEIFASLALIPQDKECEAAFRLQKAVEREPAAPVYLAAGCAYAFWGIFQGGQDCYQTDGDTLVTVADGDTLHRRVVVMERAVEAFRESARLDPTSPVAHNFLALVYLFRGEFEAAEEACDNARQAGQPCCERALELIEERPISRVDWRRWSATSN